MLNQEDNSAKSHQTGQNQSNQNLSDTTMLRTIWKRERHEVNYWHCLYKRHIRYRGLCGRKTLPVVLFELVHLHVVGRPLWCEEERSYCSLDLQLCSCRVLDQYNGALIVNSGSCWDPDCWSGSLFHPLYSTRWTQLGHFLQSRAQSRVLDLGEPPMSQSWWQVQKLAL